MVCSACSGNTALAFVPLILLLIVALIAAVSFLKGSSLISLETLADGGAKAAIEVLAKRDEMLERVDERISAEGAPGGLRSIKEKVLKYGLRLVSFIHKSGVKIKILISLWQILQGIGATFSIPFPVRKGSGSAFLPVPPHVLYALTHRRPPSDSHTVTDLGWFGQPSP